MESIYQKSGALVSLQTIFAIEKGQWLLYRFDEYIYQNLPLEYNELMQEDKGSDSSLFVPNASADFNNVAKSILGKNSFISLTKIKK